MEIQNYGIVYSGLWRRLGAHSTHRIHTFRFSFTFLVFLFSFMTNGIPRDRFADVDLCAANVNKITPIHSSLRVHVDDDYYCYEYN